MLVRQGGGLQQGEVVGVELLVLRHAAVGHGRVHARAHVQPSAVAARDDPRLLGAQVAVAQGHQAALLDLERARRITGGGVRLRVREHQRADQEPAAQVQLHALVAGPQPALRPPAALGEAQVQVQPVGGVDHGLVLHVPAVDVAQHPVEDAGQVGPRVVHAVVRELARGTAHPHVPVGQRQQRLTASLCGGVEALEHQ